eukprot:256987_1
MDKVLHPRDVLSMTSIGANRIPVLMVANSKDTYNARELLQSSNQESSSSFPTPIQTPNQRLQYVDNVKAPAKCGKKKAGQEGAQLPLGESHFSLIQSTLAASAPGDESDLESVATIAGVFSDVETDADFQTPLPKRRRKSSLLTPKTVHTPVLQKPPVQYLDGNNFSRSSSEMMTPLHNKENWATTNSIVPETCTIGIPGFRAVTLGGCCSNIRSQQPRHALQVEKSMGASAKRRTLLDASDSTECLQRRRTACQMWEDAKRRMDANSISCSLPALSPRMALKRRALNDVENQKILQCTIEDNPESRRAELLKKFSLEHKHLMENFRACVNRLQMGLLTLAQSPHPKKYDSHQTTAAEMLKKQSWQRGSSIETEVLREAEHLSTTEIVNNLRTALTAEIKASRKCVLDVLGRQMLEAVDLQSEQGGRYRAPLVKVQFPYGNMWNDIELYEKAESLLYV